MKKTMMVVLAVLVFVSLFGSTLCQAQAQSSNSWAIGTWKGFKPWDHVTWTLEISGPDGTDAGKLKGSYMWATEKQKSNMFPILISIQNDTLTFRTVSGDELALNRISDHRMDGKYKTKEKEYDVRFWKEGEANASPLLGNYESTWRESRLEASLEVLYIDDTAMSGIYGWKDLPMKSIKAGTFYVNGKLTSKRTYVVQMLDPEYQFTFLFKEGGEKILAEVLYNGECVNTATFKRK